MTLCIIPARGGSKRIPKKNIRTFAGKPMIQWSIEAARKSECFEHIVVSTDCEDIAQIAEEAGASVPFRRPAELADDHASTMAVVTHAIQWANNQFTDLNDTQQPVCCLYATAPFVQAEDIRQGMSLLADNEFVIPVTTFAHPIQRAVKVGPNGCLEMFDPVLYTARTQDLEEAWHDCGQFYWGTSHAWNLGRSPYEVKSCPLPIPRWRVQDIDTEEDWVAAEILYASLNALKTT